MKTNKKLSSLFLSLIMLFALAIPCFAETESKEKALIENGFSKEIYNELSVEATKKINELISSDKIEYIGSEILDFSAVTMHIITIKCADELNNMFSKQIMCLYWEWNDKAPLIKDEDLITITWDKDVLTYSVDSFYAEDYTKKSADELWSTVNVSKKLASSNIYSLGHYADLKKAKNYCGGVMLLSFNPASKDTVSFKNNANIIVTYKHEIRKSIIIIFLLCLCFIALIIASIVIKKRNKAL